MEIECSNLTDQWKWLRKAPGSAAAGQLLSVPDVFLQSLLDFSLERGYLDALTMVPQFPEPLSVNQSLAWIAVNRLPVHPTRVEDYDLLSRWQSVLSTLHAWGHQLVFLLARSKGRTNLFLGALSLAGQVRSASATAQLCQAAISHMPGIELKPLDSDEVVKEIVPRMIGLMAAGAVTGLPSPRASADYAYLQTLDKLAFGIRDFSNNEHDYSLVVIADPVSDGQLARSISHFRWLGSQIHPLVDQSLFTTKQEGWSRQASKELGNVFSQLCKFLPGGGNFTNQLEKVISGGTITFQKSGHTGTQAKRDFLSKLAQYCELVTDMHVARLKRGRNLGFWNTGVYFLANSETTVSTGMGILRSIYSGQKTYLEPIRVHLFNRGSGAADSIKQFRFVPLPPGEGGSAGSNWHPLGPVYETVSTPLTTEELSIATSLPRRDVPGLRFVRTAVRFATNPPPVERGPDTIILGRVKDTGVELDQDYTFDIHSLVRHALVTGITGSGKSTTCKHLLAAVGERGIPVLIIEPAKFEYLDWAVRYNETVPPEQQYKIFMPPETEYRNRKLCQLKLNPFEPASAHGKDLDFATRGDRFSTLVTATIPMDPFIAMVLDEAISRYMMDLERTKKEPNSAPSYPGLEKLEAFTEQVIDEFTQGIEQKDVSRMKASLKHKTGMLKLGKRGQILNVSRSTPFQDLFDKPAVVNLSKIANDRDRALIMGLLVMALFEYRVSQYYSNSEVQNKARNNRLCHLTIIEEAHRVLTAPENRPGANPAQGVVANMFMDMLCEIRAYGEGLLIVDQIPSRLIGGVIKNTNYKFAHRLVARDDRGAMAACMALRPDQEDILAALRPGEAIVCSDHDDAASWIKIPPPKNEEGQDQARLTEQGEP